MLELLLVFALGATIIETTEPGLNVCVNLDAPPGEYHVRAMAVDGEANHSALSNERQKVLPGEVCWNNPTENVDGTPLEDLAYVELVWSLEPIAPPDDDPPETVLLQTEETVYHVIKQPDRFVLLPIGTVPPGTSCDPNNSVNGHGAVPTDDVVWSPGSTARPVVVVARCSG